MAKITITIGVLLVLVGIAGFVGTGSAHPTALIPTWFGLALALCGILARTEDAGKRMLWMHIAVTVGLLGFIGSAFMAIKALVKAHGSDLARPVATVDQAVMALICLIFIVLCVRSFIAARRARTA